MSRIISALELGAVSAIVVLLSCGCSAGSASVSPSSSSSNAAASSFVAVPSAGEPGGAGGRLIALADGVDGGLGLWALDSESKWTVVVRTPGATGMGRTAGGIAVVTGREVDLRPAADLTRLVSHVALDWSGVAPGVPIVALDDGSAGGKLAIVGAEADKVYYALAGTDGAVTSLAGAPTQSFTPLVSWLDGTRLLVLSMDKLEQSRLAVLDVGSHQLSHAQALLGVRWFAVSSDHGTIAAATANAIYVEPAATLLGGSAPQPIAWLGPSQVVWDMALDATGSRLFTLSGTVGEDGTVGSIREIEYTRGPGGWATTLDEGVPFGRAIVQVYLP
jgi:hypothetical protein